MRPSQQQGTSPRQSAEVQTRVGSGLRLRTGGADQGEAVGEGRAPSTICDQRPQAASLPAPHMVVVAAAKVDGGRSNGSGVGS